MIEHYSIGRLFQGNKAVRRRPFSPGFFSEEKKAVLADSSFFNGKNSRLEKCFWFNGNELTRAMNLAVEKELKNLKNSGKMDLLSMVPEKSVLIRKNGSFREGRFDFFVQTDKKSIGFEILTRPSRGKLKKKLSYSERADEFVFVIPKDSLDGYKKHKKGIWQFRPHKKFLGKEFAEKKLSVWLFDTGKNCISDKKSFFEIFNITP